MLIQFVTLFPEMFSGFTETGMMRKAVEQKAVEFSLINLRDFGIGPRKSLDDIPYGGGDGMVLRPEPIVAAIEYCKNVDKEATILLPTPRGKKFLQREANNLAKNSKGLIIICPRYEGYDERIVPYIDKSYSVGEFVLTGGDIPAMAIADSVVRLLPGVLGGESSAELESFQVSSDIVEHPHYTRPRNFRGEEVPEVLFSGNHKKIQAWRQQSSINVRDNM
jgi:tRNA (guanine37-N1)-methyltransferase